MSFKDKVLFWIAQFTRRHPFPARERLIRLIHHPDKRQRHSIKSIAPYYGFKIKVDTASFLEWSVLFRGAYEPHVSEFIERIIRPESVSIDIGANVGLHTLTMSRGDFVLAVEPHPGLAERLRENLSLNHIRNVKVLQVGLSDSPGAMELYIPSPNSANQGVSSFHKKHSEALTRSIPIQVVTLDEIARELKRLDFIKIDTEGHDFKVLLGGEDTIRRFMPVIMFEWSEKSWSLAGHNLHDAVKYFEELGYGLHILTVKGEILPLNMPFVRDFEEVIAKPISLRFP